MSATLESKATDLAADIGKLGATALRIKEERDDLADALTKAADTFDDLVRVMSILGRDTTAAACHVASVGCREALTKARAR